MTYPPNIVNSAASMSPTGHSSQQYYMSIDGTLYGPYAADLMKQYASEGRIGPQSLISNDLNSGFKEAQYWPEYAIWIPQPLNPAPQETKQKHLPSVFFVIADLNSGQNIGFLKALQSLGKTQRLSESVWIMAADLDIDTLRDRLSQTLTSQDRLFIHDSFSNRAGWFNIGEGLDEKIRELWIDTAKERKAIKSNSL
jgi:hypothetical protein